MGVGPTSQAWEARILPMYYIRMTEQMLSDFYLKFIKYIFYIFRKLNLLHLIFSYSKNMIFNVIFINI